MPDQSDADKEESRVFEKHVQFVALSKKIEAIEAALIYLVRRQSENDKEFLPVLRTLVKKYVKPDGSIKFF